MQSSSLSLIESYYAAFNSGDRETLLAMLDESVNHEINESGVETGREAFRAFLQRMDRCYRETVEELVVFADGSGTRAAAEFFIRGQYLATDEGLPAAKGQEYRLRVGAFFEIAGGKVTRVTNYYNLSNWLAQVGR
ncbi:ketosteroid isomerase-related protein [Luteolibacter sp. Populi]|uniref:ketosteroid isomerase-related protein n=1 Tax=Luteolibacter sp. Populi TaxID=3230487 RepID=UPI003464FFD2